LRFIPLAKKKSYQGEAKPNVKRRMVQTPVHFAWYAFLSIRPAA